MTTPSSGLTAINDHMVVEQCLVFGGEGIERAPEFIRRHHDGIGAPSRRHDSVRLPSASRSSGPMALANATAAAGPGCDERDESVAKHASEINRASLVRALGWRIECRCGHTTIVAFRQ
jgi:hypothetical protein